MKNLKIKLGLFSLLAILAVSIFLTSCEQEITPTDELPTVSNFNENPSDIEAMPEVLLPYGYNQLSQEEQDRYVNSLDEENIHKLIKSAKIRNYFEALRKIDILLNNSKYGDIYDETTLSSYLADEEVQDFQLFIDDSLESRWGCDCDAEPKYRGCYLGSFRINGQITQCQYEKWVIECHAWYCWDDVYQLNRVCFPDPYPNCP